MQTLIGKLSVFLFLVAGVFAYLKTGASLFEKVKSSAIRFELKAIGRAIEGHKILKGQYPLNFKKFIKENFESRSPKEVGLDPWGKEYQYYVYEDGFRVISAGPNGKFQDADDSILEKKKGVMEIVSSTKELGQRAEIANKNMDQEKEESKILRKVVNLVMQDLLFVDIKKEDKELAQILERFIILYDLE